MGSESFSQSTSEQKSGPFAPQHIDNSASTLQSFLNSAQGSATKKRADLTNYINHLYQVRNLHTQAARGMAARGAAGVQNPLQVFKAMSELANQAGVPIDAEIAKTLLQSGGAIEDTLNSQIHAAADLYAKLGSIGHSSGTSQQTSSSKSGDGDGGKGGGYSSSRRRGAGGGGDGGDRKYTDIRGNVQYFDDNGNPTRRMNSGDMNSRYASSGTLDSFNSMDRGRSNGMERQGGFDVASGSRPMTPGGSVSGWEFYQGESQDGGGDEELYSMLEEMGISDSPHADMHDIVSQHRPGDWNPADYGFPSENPSSNIRGMEYVNPDLGRDRERTFSDNPDLYAPNQNRDARADEWAGEDVNTPNEFKDPVPLGYNADGRPYFYDSSGYGNNAANRAAGLA